MKIACRFADSNREVVMIIGAAQSQFITPSQIDNQSRSNFAQQQPGIKLAEDRVTLGGSGDAASQTYDRAGIIRKPQERSLTQIAWDNLLAQRVGLSKEKLDEIEQKKKDIADNPNLSAKDKQSMLEDLEKQKEDLVKEASERRKERGDEGKNAEQTT
ncbi:hypothetical protein [Aeromonas veronii]|uniref:hypothetical protein n=1 Tax=Aeromonas veronii TaxID=654 RepID=UPI00191F9623|nr:hypothetical protein [Aeromonas veronii]MBL0489512.1 hypothetical protein [Aeromonas veronii]